MKYYSAMTEEQFVDYVSSHSETERALFSKDQVAQMLDLAGYPKEAEEASRGFKKWYSVDMSDLVSEYRKNKTHLRVVK